MKEFDSVGVMVLLDGEKRGDKKHDFPRHLRAAIKGNILPFLAVTDPSGKKPIMGFSAATIKGADAVKDEARALRKKLREDESLLKPPASESEKEMESEVVAEPEKPTSPAMLAETQEWTNKDGVTITAAVQKVENGKVYFVMDGGKVVPYPATNLSKDTVDKLRGMMK